MSRACRPVVEAIAIAEQVEPGAATDVEQRERAVDARRHTGERWPDHRGSSDLVGVHLSGGEQIHDRLAVSEAHINEERPRVGFRSTGVHLGEGMIETTEQQGVDRSEQQNGVVPEGRRLGDEVEDVVALGDRATDPVVDGRVAATAGVGDVEPDLPELAHVPSWLAFALR